MKSEERVGPDEEKLGHALVKGRLITEIQLKTAMDYQKSLGGGLVDVVSKLGFVRPPVLAKFLADAKLTVPPAVVDNGPALLKRAPGPDASAARKQPPRPPAPEPPPAPLSDEESEAPTQLPASFSAAPPDREPSLKALLDLLAQKGIISPREVEMVLRAGQRVHA